MKNLFLSATWLEMEPFQSKERERVTQGLCAFASAAQRCDLSHPNAPHQLGHLLGRFNDAHLRRPSPSVTYESIVNAGMVADFIGGANCAATCIYMENRTDKIKQPARIQFFHDKDHITARFGDEESIVDFSYTEFDTVRVSLRTTNPWFKANYLAAIERGKAEGAPTKYLIDAWCGSFSGQPQIILGLEKHGWQITRSSYV